MNSMNRYTNAVDIIRRQVEHLNRALGLTDSEHKVTFGYLGNCGPSYDDRSWMVFLPHPGRCGTSADHIGGFATGDVEGALSCAAALTGALRLAEWARGTLALADEDTCRSCGNRQPHGATTCRKCGGIGSLTAGRH